MLALMEMNVRGLMLREETAREQTVSLELGEVIR